MMRAPSALRKPLRRLALGLIMTLAGGLAGAVPGTAQEIVQGMAAERFIIVASTTSTLNSGLFDFLLPQFKAQSGIQVRVVGVGTGQAIRMAERGDADVLFVHHKPSELEFVRQGFGVARRDVMFNDFVIVGPKSDPAGLKGQTVAAVAYRKIAAARAIFVSRGDDSGTHKKSLEIWRKAGIKTAAHSGSWYRESGSGMGATLNTASSMQAYTLTDRATWESFRNKGELEILSEGDPGLRNQYGIIMVNPARHRHVKQAEAKMFIDWILSAAGQTAINRFRVNAKQMFFANGG